VELAAEMKQSWAVAQLTETAIVGQVDGAGVTRQVAPPSAVVARVMAPPLGEGYAIMQCSVSPQDIRITPSPTARGN